MKILNFGSLNIDYTYHVDHFVRPGETEASISRLTACGGKGLNQSIALAKCGADVYHAGAVGKQDGAILLKALQEAGVRCGLIRQLEDTPSGSAFIQVNREGENCIVLDGGANQAITREYIDEVLEQFAEGDWLVLQNEISEIPYLMEKAHAKGMIIVLNPSPMNDAVREMPLDAVDYFLLNEDEASALAEDAADPADVLEKRYPRAALVITLGARGALWVRDGQRIAQKAFPAEAIDTVGAGDTFTGFLIGSLCSGSGPEEALRTASMASSISVTRRGASTSIPDLAEVRAALSERPE